MGRKKKKITSNTLGVGYSGKVKISLIKDNKALITKEYKNTGNWPMFYFLNLCLSGEYNKAEAYRPKYLKLFNAGAKGTDPSSIDIDEILADPENITSLSTIIYNQTPYTSKTTGTTEVPNGKAETTFKFMVPFTQILNDEDKPTNLFVMYDQEHRNTIATPSAYFLLLDEEGKLDTIDTSSLLSNDYNLFIQWTITTQNQI